MLIFTVFFVNKVQNLHSEVFRYIMGKISHKEMGDFRMKKPKCIIGKQDYSVLTVLACAVMGCILLLIVVWTSEQGHLWERVIFSLIFGSTALGAGAMFGHYIAYLKQCSKKENVQNKSKDNDTK